MSLAVMVPLAAGQFDLSVGYQVCLMHILAIGLQVRMGIHWVAVIFILLVIAALIGLINGLLVAYVGVSSFIATLGVGTILFGLAFWYTDGAQLIGALPPGFLRLNSNIGPVPMTIIVTLVVAIVLFVITEHTPLGRFFYFLGANQKAAILSGISPKKYLIFAFMFSSVVASIAGVLLASIIRVGQISIGPDYLMSSFAGALMGSVAFTPGKVNVWGTVCAVLIMAFTVSGLQQMGARFFVDPLFNGGMLILAVSLAVITERHKATKVDKERKTHNKTDSQV